MKEKILETILIIGISVSVVMAGLFFCAAAYMATGALYIK